MYYHPPTPPPYLCGFISLSNHYANCQCYRTKIKNVRFNFIIGFDKMFYFVCHNLFRAQWTSEFILWSQIWTGKNIDIYATGYFKKVYRSLQVRVPHYILTYLSIHKLPQKRSHQSNYLSNSQNNKIILCFNFITNKITLKYFRINL